MKTESVQEYKGYFIRRSFRTNSGANLAIYKLFGDKKIYLRIERWTFYDPSKLLTKACNFIDNFPERLIEKYDRLTKQLTNGKN